MSQLGGTLPSTCSVLLLTTVYQLTKLSNYELNLHKYELQDDEWAIAQNLCDTSKVGILSHN